MSIPMKRKSIDDLFLPAKHLQYRVTLRIAAYLRREFQIKDKSYPVRFHSVNPAILSKGFSEKEMPDWRRN